VEVIPPNQLMAPARFIQDRQLTVWSSVPSIAAFMRRMKMLEPGAFPTLRYSVFAGEALPWSLAEVWQTAAPDSIVENLYGPTEATVYYRGQPVATQVRNSGGVKFADGYYVLTTLVDTTGYSTAVAAKYQAYLIAEVPIKVGGEKLAAGVISMNAARHPRSWLLGF
jgi:acyl-coenzyme A synthetase/AMP-(fatty) acid ligase